MPRPSGRSYRAFLDRWTQVLAEHAALTVLSMCSSISSGIYGILLVAIMLLRPEGLLPGRRRRAQPLVE